MAPKDPRAEDVPTVPLAPEDLRRAYADIAYGYHTRLPALELAVRDAVSNSRQGLAVAAKAQAAAEEAAELAGKCLACLAGDRVANDPFPPAPRVPSRTDPEDEVTLNGKTFPVVHGEVPLTKSDFEALKMGIRVARESWSLAQKVIVAVGATVVLGLGGLAGAAMHSAWSAVKVTVVPSPPVVVSVDAGPSKYP